MDCMKHRPDEGDNHKCILKLEKEIAMEAKKISPNN